MGLTSNNKKKIGTTTTLSSPIVSKVVSSLASRNTTPTVYGGTASALSGAQKIAADNANTVYGGSGPDLLAPNRNTEANNKTVTNSGKYGVTNTPIDPNKTYTADATVLIGNTDNDALSGKYTPAGSDLPTGGGNGGGSGYGSLGLYDPSSDLLAAYNARQAALQQNYDAALAQLKKSYEDSVSGLRTQGEDALRQAYINMMMNKRGLGQSLEAQGLRGGATESSLANLYNNYASNRNEIARAVEDKLADIGNTYGNNVANLGMQYNTNSADAMSDYQTQLANARQSLASTLAKTGSNSKGTNTIGLNTDYINVLKGLAKNPKSAINYARSRGLSDDYLYAAGIDPTLSYDDAQSTGLNEDYVAILKQFKNDPVGAKAYGDSVGGLSDDYYWAAGVNPNSFNDVDSKTLAAIKKELEATDEEARRHTRNENLIEQSLAERMRELARLYGLTEGQARNALAALGY